MSRTEQLGLPIPRKLIATKEEFENILERRNLNNLDKHLEKSLKTIYCKMVAHKNRKCSYRKRKRKKVPLSDDEFQKWLENIARPKKLFEPEPLERVKGKIDTNRLKLLSQPKHQLCPEEDDKNKITAATLNYVATERILYLAQRRKETELVYETHPISFPINPQYASVKSMGIDKLSVPRHPKNKYHKVTTDERCAYSPVSKTALKYEPSALIRKLAQPMTLDEEELGDFYKVKKKALMKLPKKKENIYTKLATPIEWKVTPKFEVK